MGGAIIKANEDEDLAKRANEIEQLEKKKYGEIDQFFHKFDSQGNGALDDKEFEEAIKAYISMHPEKKNNLNDLLNNLEIGNSSQIRITEFRKIMIAYLTDDVSIENLIDVYRCFDKNLMGSVGASELKHVFSKLGLNISNEEALELVREADADDDGSIDFEEFVKMMISK